MLAVRQLLEMLGNDADDVARFLLSHGFKGITGLGEDCPVANYLKANGVQSPAVDLSTVTYMQGDECIVEDLPGATEDFVMMFDDGEYPALDAEKE